MLDLLSMYVVHVYIIPWSLFKPLFYTYYHLAPRNFELGSVGFSTSLIYVVKKLSSLISKSMQNSSLQFIKHDTVKSSYLTSYWFKAWNLLYTWLRASVKLASKLNIYNRRDSSIRLSSSPYYQIYGMSLSILRYSFSKLLS